MHRVGGEGGKETKEMGGGLTRGPERGCGVVGAKERASSSYAAGGTTGSVQDERKEEVRCLAYPMCYGTISAHLFSVVTLLHHCSNLTPHCPASDCAQH